MPLSSQDENATETRDKLKKIDAEIERRKNRKEALEKQAEDIKAERKSLAQQMVDTGREIRLTEETIGRLDIRIVELEKTSKNKRETLLANKDDMVELIAALQLMSKRPTSMTLLAPREVLDTARSAAVLGNILPYINTEATRLRSELTALADLYKELSNRRAVHKDSLQKLARQNRNLQTLIAERERVEQRSRSAARRESRRVEALLNDAKTTKELLARLEEELKKAEARSMHTEVRRFAKRPDGVRTQFAQSRGSLPYPVVGKITTRYGAKDGAFSSKGIKIQSRPASQVVSPFDGKIVFAGQFRDYGQMIIISHGNGYHSLVAGLNSLYGTLGQWVLQGEPIGAIAGRSPSDTQVYFEIRRNGKSINPEPWLSKSVG